MTTTDTPRTDACPYCGHTWSKSWGMWDCGAFEQTKGLFRTELCYERSARQKAEREISALQRLRPTRDDVKKLEAEVERLRERAEKAEAKANKLENSLRRIIDAPVFDPAKLIDFSMKLLWNSIDEAKATLNPTEK